MSARADTAVLPEERLWLWRIGFPPVRALAAFLCPWRLERGDRVPKVGGYILVANHVNWKDPPWIEFALGRAIRYMGKRELFEVPVIGYVLRSIGAFPVRRGEVDRGALHMAESVIEAGQPLGFFPEGHRSESGALIRGRNGVGYVALRTNAPIILIAVVGTKRARLGAFWRRDILLRGSASRSARAILEAMMRRSRLTSSCAGWRSCYPMKCAACTEMPRQEEPTDGHHDHADGTAQRPATGCGGAASPIRRGTTGSSENRSAKA